MDTTGSSKQKHDGGRAFPTDYKMDCPECRASVIGATPHSGMSLRDWFAGQALMVSAAIQWESDFKAPVAAKTAYEIAAAMLKERDR